MFTDSTPLATDTPSPDAHAIARAPRVCRLASCSETFTPRTAHQLYCTDPCRIRARDLRRERDPAVEAKRSLDYHQQNKSYRAARKALLRAGKDPDANPHIDKLRDRGEVENWREVIGLPRRAPGPAPAARASASPLVEARTGEAAEAPDAAPAVDPWSLPSPSVEHVGHALAVGFSPHAEIELTGTRLLHGAITFAVAEPHERRRSGWSLAPSDRGWVAVFNNRSTAERMRAQSFDSRLGAEPRRLLFGASLVHMKGPRPLPAGRYRVTFETLTPVVWGRFGSTRVTTAPTRDTILASVERVALFVGADVPFAHRAVESVSSETKTTKVFAGGKWRRGSGVNGLIRGIEGGVSVVCNAPVAWLLACAEVVGIGSSSSIGFGRVRVRVCPL